MRNTLEHPITLKEISDCLQQLSNEIEIRYNEELVCGDMRPLLLYKAAQIIQQLDKTFLHSPKKVPEEPESEHPFDLMNYGAATADYNLAKMIRDILDRETNTHISEG